MKNVQMAAVHTGLQSSLVYKLTKVAYSCPQEGVTLGHLPLTNSLCGGEFKYQRQPEVPDGGVCFVPDWVP